jgi:hypothetical protein
MTNGEELLYRLRKAKRWYLVFLSLATLVGRTSKAYTFSFPMTASGAYLGITCRREYIISQCKLAAP